jgi:two-component system nitrate/nitrite response regulator NarL
MDDATTLPCGTRIVAMPGRGKKGVSVLVAEDHPVMRAGVVDAVHDRPGLELIAEASTGDETLEAIRNLQPDVAVVDMKLPGLDGLEVMLAVAAEHLATRVLFLSGYIAPTTVYDAIQAGASGYVSKDLDAEGICDAIAQVAAGHVVMNEQVQRAIAGEIRDRRIVKPPLSPREREILTLTAHGQSAAAIARQLYLSEATVKTHLQRTYKKLEVSDRAAAVAAAMRLGLLD